MNNKYFITQMYLLIAIAYMILAIANYWLTERGEEEIAQENRKENRGRVYQERENAKESKRDSLQDDE